MEKYILNNSIRLKFDKASMKYYAFCISSGSHFILTKTGYFILEFLEKGKSIDEIIIFIHKKERIELDVCKTDTLNFINKSEKVGLIAIDKEKNQNEKKEQN